MDEEPHGANSLTFEFTDKTGEYFKIWIANVALTVLTLGIYSAWAKVRKRRYFYGNTRLEDAPFEYLADPMKILKGRLIVFGIYVAYTASAYLAPIPAAVFFGLLFVAALPWAVIRARAFNARNSSYRNIRFNFKARYGEGFKVFTGLLALAVITLGIGYPHYVRRRSEFTMNHSSYGTTPFEFAGTTGSFYAIYLKAAAIGVIGLLVAGGLFAATVGHIHPGHIHPEMSMLGLLVPVIIFYSTLLLVAVYVLTAVANLVWSNTTLGANRLRSTLQTSQMIWLYFSNAVAILASLGLLIPWASIRMARYRLANLKLHAVESLDGYVAAAQEAVSAVGEEATDFFDFDVGI